MQSCLSRYGNHKFLKGFTHRVVLLLSLLTFMGSAWGLTEKTLTVSRSAYSVNTNVNADLGSVDDQKYGRFYLTDANGDAVNPTGKLVVRYGNDAAIPCPTPDNGFYIFADQNGVNLTKEMFYNYSNDDSNFNRGTSGGWVPGGTNYQSANVVIGEGEDGSPAMVLVNKGDNNGQPWTAQLSYTFNKPLQQGNYTISFRAKSSVDNGFLQSQYQNSNDPGNNAMQGGYGNYPVGKEWTTCGNTFNINRNDIDRITINFGQVGGTYTIDNIVVRRSDGTPIISPTEENSKAESNFGTPLGEGGLVIGTSNVFNIIYADLTDYKKMVFEGTPNTEVRLVLNRRTMADRDFEETTVKIGADGKGELDLTTLKLPYIHLNAIKIPWNGTTDNKISSIKLFKWTSAPKSTLDLSKLSVQLVAQKEYKLYNVVCRFSDQLPDMNNGKITQEKTFSHEYVYSFDYNITTKEKEDYADWRSDGSMIPVVQFTSIDKDWDTSWEELSLGYYVKWYVVDVSGKQVGLVSGTRQNDNWAINADGYTVNNNEAVLKGNENLTAEKWDSYKKATFYAPANMTYEQANGYKIICEIYTNSTGTGEPNACYTFSMRNFLGELQGNNTGGTTMDIKKGVTSLELNLSKITYSGNAKYARIWLTTTDGTMVDPTDKLVIEGMTKYVTEGYTDARFGYYLFNKGGNISWKGVNVILNLPLGTYNQYQVHVALSEGAPTFDEETGEITHEPDKYNYVYTYNFTYPVKTKYKTLIINSATNPNQVQPQLIRNWLELASDCGVDKQAMNKLIVRWYFENDKGNEIEIPGFNCQYCTEITGNKAKGWYKDGILPNELGDDGKGGWYNDKITLWTGYQNYKNIRLVCVASTKTDNYTPNVNNWQDPEIQVKYVYTLLLNSELQTFAHYEGEAHRYLTEIGQDATDYGYLTSGKDKNIGTNTAAPTWNSETNEYNTDERSVRQNVHTVDYYYYVSTNTTDEPLLLPLESYTGGGNVTEPRAYFRWYDYKTDRKSDYLNKVGDKLDLNDYGHFVTNWNGGQPRQATVGVTFNATSAFTNGSTEEILIACDVSRYMDGMDESFTYFVHEPTLSVRYLFHIRPASVIANEITNKANANSLNGNNTGLAAVEEKIIRLNDGTSLYKDKTISILENEGRMVVSTNGGYGEFALRTQLSDLKYYYITADDQARSLWWYAYYKDDKGNWWRHLIPNKEYRDRVGHKERSGLWRAQTYQAKYSLKPKQWPDSDASDETAGDFDGDWKIWNGYDWANATEGKPTIDVGYRVQMVGCVSTDAGSQNVPAPTSTIMPIIWTELEFIDAKPLELGKEDSKRTDAYMTTEYVPADTLDFNDFSLLGIRQPTHSYENYATVPLHYPNAQYGFIYPQLTGYCATQRDNNTFGMAPMHGDYTLLKSMGMPGVSIKKGTSGSEGQSIQVAWVSGGTLYDVTHEREHGKTTPDSENYGGFLYVDAADEARTIATLEFDATLCSNAKFYYTAYVASMTAYTIPKDVNGSAQFGKNPGDANASPQTAPSLRFRVSVLDEILNSDNQKIGERYVPVVTFVTGNIRQEVSYVDGMELPYLQSPFKEAQWYQVYGYATIPEEFSDLLLPGGNHFRVEIDNYCDNTDGADYCVDQIMFYTNSASLKVQQKAKIDCNEDGMFLNLYMKKEEMEKLQLWGKENTKIYWRICDEKGTPLKDASLYGEFLANEDELKTDPNKIPYGYTTILALPTNNVFPSEPDQHAHYGYFESAEDGQCFSLANMFFYLTEGENYCISVNIDNPDNADGWGKPDETCSTFSKVFVPKALYLSVSDIKGNVNPTVEVTCSDHIAHLANYNMILNVPDETAEGGFMTMDIPFDYFVGDYGDLNEYVIKNGDGEISSTLDDILSHYRARGESDTNKKQLSWKYNKPGLDEKYKEVCEGSNDDKIKKYYSILEKAVEDGKLYLACSHEFSLPIDVDHTTILAFATQGTVENSQGQSFEVCSPMALTFKVDDNLYDPMAILGFGDVKYPNDTRVIRVGKEQLNNMQKNSFLLHIPVNKFKTRTRRTGDETEEDPGKTGDETEENPALNVIGKLELLAYAPATKAAGTGVSEDVNSEGTNDPDVDVNYEVATFTATDGTNAVIKDGYMYVSVDFMKDIKKVINEQTYNFKGFKEGFTYRMFFRVQKANATAKDCEANVEFLMKVVPEYVTWNDAGTTVTPNGNVNTNWNNDKNWSRSKRAELHKGQVTDGETADNHNSPGHPNGYKDNGDLGITTTPAAFVPMKFTYVTIPSGNKAPVLNQLVRGSKDNAGENEGIYTDGSIGEDATENIQYDMMVRIEEKCEDEDHAENNQANIYDCEKYYGNVCKEIYFKPSTELINQQFLTYEKAWVEKELVANKWYLMSTPLKETYAGDMYVPTDGQQNTEAFRPINFTDKVAKDEQEVNLYSRTAYPIYQRSWGTAFASTVYTQTTDTHRSDYSANLGYTTWSVNIAEWGHTFNDVDVDYTKMTGFSIRAHKKDQTAKALIRLPKDDAGYEYYDYKDDLQGGAGSRFSKTTTDIGQFLTVSNNADITLKLEDAQQMGGYVLVGNPYMASLDMKEFFNEKVNPDLTKGYYTYRYDEIEDKYVIGQHGENNLDIIYPLESFFVNIGTATEIKFTADMMIDGNTYETAPSRMFALIVSNDRGRSSATVSVGEEARSVETLFDSNLNDVPMVYTVANGQAVSINQVTELSAPIAFGVTCTASDEPVAVMFSDIAQLTSGEVYVVDAATGEQTLIGEGSTLSIQPNDYGRYFLLAGILGISDNTDVQKGIMVSVRGRVVTVTSVEALTQVRVLSANGTTVYQNTTGGTSASFTLGSGIYIIQAENAAGEQQTVKVVVK